MDILKTVTKKIREHTGKTPDDEHPPTDIPISPAVVKFKEHEITNDPMADRAAIESIESVYYQGEGFDVIKHELQKLPETLDLMKIDDDRVKMELQLSAVSKQVSKLVLEKHAKYEVELNRVIELQKNLKTASAVCSHGRRHLDHAKVNFTTASLGLLSNYKKRQQLYALLKTLRTVHTLQRTDIRLREMLEEEDYPGAIQLCLECQKAASIFRHYRCISELSSKLQDTLEMIEESLDVALSKTCGKFDEKHYEKVQRAYRLLGKTQTATDQRLMHFTNVINNTAFTIVLGYVELCSPTGDSNFQRRQYKELCENISVELFTPCLVDLCKALWEVMKSYHKTIKWHEGYEREAEAEGTGSGIEASLNRRYIEQKLRHGLGRIWGDVQTKLKMYLLSTDLSYFKYELFIQVLDIVNRLIQIGEEFCGSKSEGLQESIRTQSINYFRSYHLSRMDELRTLLENEGWEIWPVKQSFHILQLQEFKFLRSQRHDSDCLMMNANNEPQPDQGFFDKYDIGSPFDARMGEDEEEEDRSDSPSGTLSPMDSDTEDPDLLADSVHETGSQLPSKSTKVRRNSTLRMANKKAHIITNTTLGVCRLFGKYMQMMSVLKPIAFDVIICMSELFDYYLYTIYTFFANDSDAKNEHSMSSKLQTTLRRISNRLIMEDDPMNGQQNGTEERQDKFPHPRMASFVNLTSDENLFGLATRVVATESLVFLGEQFEFLQRYLQSMIPEQRIPFLQQFYSQTVSTAPELRKPVYRTVASRAIDYDLVLQQMSAVRWDIRDIVSQHSNYVNVLLQEMETFNRRLCQLSTTVPIPQPVHQVLWEHCISLANRTLVEGFSQAKKCTHEGRGLMQVDFQNFIKKLEDITDLSPIPEREYVDAYIKAYYFPEAQLEMWIKEHKEYTKRQVISLVQCERVKVGRQEHLSKKSKNRLVKIIESRN